MNTALAFILGLGVGVVVTIAALMLWAFGAVARDVGPWK